VSRFAGLSANHCGSVAPADLASVEREIDGYSDTHAKALGPSELVSEVKKFDVD
jgi:hypothetical protein